jgi:hypothetical protein
VSSKRRFLRIWAIGSLLWIAAAGGALRRDYDFSAYLTLRNAARGGRHDTVNASLGKSSMLIQFPR